LAFYLLFPNITCIHTSGIKGIVITDQFVAWARDGISPDGILGLTILHSQGPVMGYPLKFANSPLRRRIQKCCFDVLGRNIINRRVAFLQHTQCLASVGDFLTIKNHAYSLAGTFHSRGPGIIPNGFFGGICSRVFHFSTRRFVVIRISVQELSRQIERFKKAATDTHNQ
jgi:hypothetical protein